MTPKRRNRKKVEEEDKKGVKGSHTMRTIIGERMPYDRYDVRSRNCHTTDAHVC